MKKVLSLLLLIIILAGCKKIIEKKQNQMIIDAITNGRWKVSDYVKTNDNLTANFNGYEFQFHSNETVDAIHNNSVEKTGTWKVSQEAGTITADFPLAGEPLVLLNGTWQITNTTWTSVNASLQVNNETCLLKLEKLP
jgi:hypothetical protein